MVGTTTRVATGDDPNSRTRTHWRILVFEHILHVIVIGRLEVKWNVGIKAIMTERFRHDEWLVVAFEVPSGDVKYRRKAKRKEEEENTGTKKAEPSQLNLIFSYRRRQLAAPSWRNCISCSHIVHLIWGSAMVQTASGRFLACMMETRES